MRWRAAVRLAACLQVLSHVPPCTAAHYERLPCQSDEVQGEVQDASGYVCAPRCSQDAFTCATDVPSGTSAQPQCMLQDVDRGSHCGLLCWMDSQCPNGARCNMMKQVEVGICLYPVSFADWAHNNKGTKLTVGWPSKPGGGQQASPTGYRIAKTYAALQRLKSKYTIDDGDADMLILKELLSSIGAAASQSSSAVAASATPGGGGGGDQMNAWRHDLVKLERNLARGLPGIEDELNSGLNDVEHIFSYHSAANLLRAVIWIALFYVGVGSLFKYQMGARGVEMLPHIGFWRMYPGLVADGITYAKMLAGDILGVSFSQGGGASSAPMSDGIRSGGAGAFEAL